MINNTSNIVLTTNYYHIYLTLHTCYIHMNTYICQYHHNSQIYFYKHNTFATNMTIHIYTYIYSIFTHYMHFIVCYDKSHAHIFIAEYTSYIHDLYLPCSRLLQRLSDDKLGILLPNPAGNSVGRISHFKYTYNHNLNPSQVQSNIYLQLSYILYHTSNIVLTTRYYHIYLTLHTCYIHMHTYMLLP